LVGVADISKGGPSVRVEHTAGLAELVLAAPERSNAIDLDLARLLGDAVEEIAALDGLRVVLIRAEGRNFCVGGDVRSFAAHLDDLGTYVKSVADAIHHALQRLAELPVPVLSAVQGAVAGAGIGLAFSADLVYLARTSKVRVAYTAIGLSPDNGASWFLPKLVGPRRALELALTNRTLSAPEALDWGLATAVVDDDAVLDEARQTAQRLHAMSTDALIATKRLLHGAARGRSLPDQLAVEAETIAALATTPAAREAILRFIEK
jgi:2-(1,2-epoxy-1,2-dihydrophenyl)acetyl-CoA isomerase